MDACADQRARGLSGRRRSAGDTGAHLAFTDFTGTAMTLDPSKDFLDPRLPSTEYETFKRRTFPRRIVLRYFPAAEKELAGPAPCEEVSSASNASPSSARPSMWRACHSA